MHRRTIGLSAIVAATLTIGANGVTAQQKPLKEQLIGTWIMVSAVATTKEGTKSSDRWSANPQGANYLWSRRPLFVHDFPPRHSKVRG